MPMPAWPSGVVPVAGIEAQDREVAGATAEVADQHGGGLGERAGEAGAGGLRFQGERYVGQAGIRIGAAQPCRAQRVVDELAGEAHRTADDDARGRWYVGEQGAQEAADQALQREGMAEDAGLGEAALRQVGLHRHDQPAVERILQIGGDRFGAGFLSQLGAAAAWLGPETQDGAEYVERCVAARGHAAVILADRDDAVGGAEIDADRRRHAVSPREGRGFKREWADDARGLGGMPERASRDPPPCCRAGEGGGRVSISRLRRGR